MSFVMPCVDAAYHLHFSRAGSFLAMTSLPGDLEAPTASLYRPMVSSARKLALTYHDARQLYQTVWWMRRIRSRGLTHSPDLLGEQFGKTFHSVRLTMPVEDVLEASSLDCLNIAYTGVSDLNGEYDPRAFLRLVVKLLAIDAPKRFGAAWTSQDLFADYSTAGMAREAARVKAVSADLLRDYLAGRVAPEAIIPIVCAAGWLGWQDLRGELELASSRLLRVSEEEELLLELEADLRARRLKLGPRGTRYYQCALRDTRRASSRQPPGERLLWAPVTAEEEARFGELDRCYREFCDCEKHFDPGLQEIAVLRWNLARALRQLSLRDDAEGLVQWSRQDPDVLGFVVARLADLDPARTIALLSAVEKTDDKENSFCYASSRAIIQGRQATVLTARPETPDGRKALLQILLDLRPESPRNRALERLVPPEEPKRYPAEEIDAALLELLQRKVGPKEERPEDLALAAARRLGGKAWDALVQYAGHPSPGIPTNAMRAFQPLTLLAHEDPARRRATMLELLQPELTTTYGRLDRVLWSIWELDLQELKPDLERIATAGPEEYGGFLALGCRQKLTPVTERYHLARQIVALWNEEDPLTRARLLVAFALAHADRLADGGPAAMAHFTRQLEEAWRGLSAEQRAAGEELVRWCEEHAYAALERPIERASFDAVLRAIRSTIGHEHDRVTQLGRSPRPLFPLSP